MIPGSYTLLYLEPCETLRNDKLQECILSRSACHSIYKHSSAHQDRPRVWFHTCITTEAGPGEAAWAQQIVFQPIQDHGLWRVMGCPLTADWKWMVDRAHVTCIPFTHRWLITSCKVNHSTLRRYPRSQTLRTHTHIDVAQTFIGSTSCCGWFVSRNPLPATAATVGNTGKNLWLQALLLAHVLRVPWLCPWEMAAGLHISGWSGLWSDLEVKITVEAKSPSNHPRAVHLEVTDGVSIHQVIFAHHWLTRPWKKTFKVLRLGSNKLGKNLSKIDNDAYHCIQ